MRTLLLLCLLGSARAAFAQQSQAELQQKIQALIKKDVPGTSKNAALYKEAEATYKAYLTQYPTATDIGEARFGYAEVLFRLGELGDNTRWPTAAKQYQEILDQDAKGPRGAESALGLLVSTERWAALIPAQETPGVEVESILKTYQGLYQKLQSELPKSASNSEVGGQCAYRLGELYAKYHQEAEAIVWLERGLEDFPTSSSEEATATQLLVILLEQNKTEALRTYIDRFRKDNELSKVQAFQGALDQIDRQLSKQSCIGYFDKQDWLAAAKCFEGTYKAAPKEQQAALLFNAATSYQKAQQPARALPLYQELAKGYPNTKEGAAALLQSGYLSLRLLDTEGAVASLEAYGKKHLAEREAEDALLTASLLRGATLQYEEAIADLNLVLSIINKSSSRKGEASALSLRIAKLREQQGDPAKAQKAWEQLSKINGISHADLARALASLGHLAWLRGKRTDAEKNCTQAVSLFKSVTDNQEEALFETEPLARCAFYLGELQVQKAEAIPVPKVFDEKKIDAWNKNARAQIDAARKTLNQVKDFGATTWALGALFRAGQMSFVYAQNLEGISLLVQEKGGAPPDVLEALKSQTASWVESSRKDAALAWSTCAEGAALVQDPGVWMEQCEAMLSLLNPTLYPQPGEWVAPATTEPPPLAVPSLIKTLQQ